MKGFTSWFTGKPNEEEKAKFNYLQDSSKPLKKRFSILLQITKSLEKSASYPGYNEKLHEFFKEYGEDASNICLSLLRNLEGSKNKGKNVSWDDILAVFKTLIEITRYGQMNRVVEAQEIACVCLYEDNRWELRDIGFTLVLNLLNFNINLPYLQHLFLASLDLSQFRSEDSVEIIFPDRSILTTGPNPLHFPWLALAQEAVRKSTPSMTMKELKELEQMTGQSLTVGIKNTLLLISKVFEYSVDADIPPTPESKQEHFKRWFNLLKKTLLFLIYPGHCTGGENMSNDWGFRNGTPPTLQYMISNWFIKYIKDQEILDCLLSNITDYEFVINTLGLSFKMSENYIDVCYKTANKCLKLFEEWVDGRQKPSIDNPLAQKHLANYLPHCINLFDFSSDFSPKRIDLCKIMIKLLEKLRMKEDFWKIIHDISLNLAEKLAETHSLTKPFHDIIEPTAEFLLSTITTIFSKTTIDWVNYSKIIRRWSKISEPIVDHWHKIMLDLTGKLKEINFQSCLLLDNWLQMLNILGEPLNFIEKVQNFWANSVNDIVKVIISYPLSSASPSKLLGFFFYILSRLIRMSKSKETQIIAFNTLTSLFINTKCEELPMDCYIQQLSLILFLSTQKPHLHISILESAPKLLDFPGMHFLIKSYLEICENNYPQALKLIFYIMCFPNYYKNTPLFDPADDPMTYFDLKPIIKNTLEICLEKPELSSSVLYGLTVFALEEITSEIHDTLPSITDLILNKCLSSEDNTALAAFHCLQPLVSILPNLCEKILVYLVEEVLTTVSTTREKVLKTALNAIQHCLLTSPIIFNEEILTNLFSTLSILLISVEGNQTLEAEINALSSFLSIYYLNFPLKQQSSAVFQSLVKDDEFLDENSQILHFALGTSVIFSIILSTNKAKFIIRNQFGKFCWESEDYRIFENSTKTEEFLTILNVIQSTSIELNSQDPPNKLDDEPLLPLLIDYIANTYSECYVKDKAIEAGQEMLRLMDSVEELEAECEVIESRSVPPAPNFSMIRYFVSNLGLLQKLVPLESGEKLDRGVVLLDNCQPREPIKIGIIYVGQGQQDEKEVLANSFGSLAFQKFVQSLGNVIDVRQHIGNLGGLDPSGSAGTITISYADFQYDVIFHVVPLMPTIESDEQQVLKKRHVGNDIVHIIWSDHWRDYRRETMLTHFNFIVIIIYPLTPMMFRIQILKKFEVDTGPLQDGMVIPWKLLGPLVRQTAIHANQQIRLIKHANYEKQIHVRRRQIEELVQRYSLDSVQKYQTYASMF